MSVVLQTNYSNRNRKMKKRVFRISDENMTKIKSAINAGSYNSAIMPFGLDIIAALDQGQNEWVSPTMLTDDVPVMALLFDIDFDGPFGQYVAKPQAMLVS